MPDALQNLVALNCTFICLTETWHADGEHLPDMQGYVYHDLVRPSHLQSGKVSHGGIAVYIKREWADRCSVWKCAPDGTYLWLHVRLGGDHPQHVAFATCYMPPGHKHKDLSTFKDLSADMRLLSQELPRGVQFWVCGDTNAHTGTLPDHVMLEGPEIPDAVQALDELPEHVPERRNECPHAVDRRGRQQLQFCKDNSLLILNGRVHGDPTGRTTFMRGRKRVVRTTLDYHMASSALYPWAERVEVLQKVSTPYMSCSDHHPVMARFRLPAAQEPPAYNGQADQPAHSKAGCLQVPAVKFEAEREEQYWQHFLCAADQQQLDAACADPEAGVLTMTRCLADAAVQTFALKKGRGQKPRQFPVWFDAECWASWREWKAAARAPVLTAHHAAANSLRCRHRAVRRRKYRQFLTNEMRRMDHLSLPDLHRIAGWRRRPGCPLSSAIQAAHMQKVLGSHPASAAVPKLLPEDTITGVHIGTDAFLNADCTISDVRAGLRKLSAGKAAGIDGMSAELLKHGPFHMQHCLAKLFTSMLKGTYPTSLSTGLVTAVYKGKRRDPLNMNSYRPITVVPVLAKLFATVMEQRMTRWAEALNLRAPPQAGFRRGHSTAGQLSTLNILVRKYRRHNSKLFCCFVDFEKAFDTVDRGVLWAVLQNLGVCGHFMSCLQSMYAQDSAAVRAGGGISEAFRCLQGVQQGSPLSPLLFGLLIDVLDKVMRKVKGNHAPTLMFHDVPLLLFADDLVLMSTSEEGLQRLLNALQIFCENRRLRVNLVKTEVVVFETQRQECSIFTYSGHPLTRSDSFKYLGLWFEATKEGFAKSLGEHLEAARKTMNNMLRRCAQISLTCPRRICKLFDALVLPILSYGCEVWFWDHRAGTQATAQLESLHAQFLRRLLGIHCHTHSLIALAEFGRYPLAVHWQRQVDRFRQRIWDLKPKLQKEPLLWAMYDGVCYLPLYRDLSLAPFCALQAHGSAETAPGKNQHEQRFRDCQAATVATYMQMRGPNTAYAMQTYLTRIRGFRLRRAYASIRCSSHQLRVQTGRYLLPQLKREDRTCRICGSPNEIEDESHILLHCPGLADLRSAHSHLFAEQQQSLATLFEQPPSRVATYIRAALLQHATMLGITGGTSGPK